MRDKGYSFHIVNPADFEQDFLFLQAIEQNSILISEIRSPHITPDVLGLVHNQCIPTIRICHLEASEGQENIEAAMHLSRNEEKWIEQDQGRWPILLSKYQIGDEMEPVIFWRRVMSLPIA